ncbi:hypothetical protein EL22_19005 [Halostagnicola sp. A56]|nr:hypothetical protein EL22_19005 [Halostagnicola sp. A56]
MIFSIGYLSPVVVASGRVPGRVSRVIGVIVVSPFVASLRLQSRFLVDLVLYRLPDGVGALDFLATGPGQRQATDPGVGRLGVGDPASASIRFALRVSVVRSSPSRSASSPSGVGPVSASAARTENCVDWSPWGRSLSS